MGPRKKKGGGLRADLKIGEDVRIAVHLALKKFRNTEEDKELEFPSSLTSEERAYIHRLSGEFGLKSKSRGKGASRYLTVYKREGSTIMQSDATLNLSQNSKKYALNLLNQFPVTNKERQELLPPTDRERNPYLLTESRDMSRAMGKLNSGIPQIPPCPSTCDLGQSRMELPIWPHRSEVIEAIRNGQVTLITGDTGSGKTTQVPQFILEHSFEQQTPCRIICTEPRRLAAVSVAERVAAERDEKIGQTVGFQIRLESRVSPKTLLTFCTNGVLLRTLMGGDAALGTVTHIIIDEIHERDRFSDFLLTVIRDALNKFRSLKLILMSATVDVNLFLNFFSGARHISIPGRCFPVKEIFLEEILETTEYTNPAIEKMRKQAKVTDGQVYLLNALTKGMTLDGESSTEEAASIGEEVLKAAEGIPEGTDDGDDVVVEDLPVEEDLKRKADAALQDAFMNGYGESFERILSLIFEDNLPIDYKHPKTGVTTLMAAAGRGNIDVLEQLLAAGADIQVRAVNTWTARDFALKMGQQAACEVLESYQQSFETMVCDEPYSMLETETLGELTEEQRDRLDVYHKTFNDEKVDYDLIVHIIKFIQAKYPPEGSILVFLSGYEDIVNLRDQLQEQPDLLVLCLHSQMVTLDQRKIFRPPPADKRKVILSTNVAETSITINDVVFVIDAGKVKEKSFDSLTSVSMLKTVWISQTSAAQRKGRAGRCQPGAVFRIYSSIRHKHFLQYQTPEILRTPLMELCLHTKLLAPPNTPIADFLAKTPEPPSFMVTRNAVQMLKTMEALDTWEDVTELGNHLLDMPIEPRLAKMVLYAVVLKCLDPVLTIVCCIAYRDPFILPENPSLKRIARTSRQKFSGSTYSDHMSLLRAFQSWQKARVEGSERSFCYRNQISASTMEMVTGMRSQLLGQLRASGFVRARGPGDIRDLNKNSENWAVVKAALTAGSYPNLARFDKEAVQLRTQKESKVRLHPSSVLLDVIERGGHVSSARNKAAISKLPTEWLVFDEMTRAGHIALIRGVTAVSPVTVLIFAGPNRLPLESVSEADAGVQGNMYLEESSDSEVEEKPEGENTMLRIDDWTAFRSDAELAHLALQLRQKWSSLFLRRLHSPNKPMSQVDESVVHTIVQILNSEEQTLGLTQPSGIGQRPRPIPTEPFSSPSMGARRGSSDTIASDDSVDPSAMASRIPSPPQALIPGSNRFFIIKATTAKAIDVSVNHGLWQFGNQTEKRLLKVIKAGFSVILIFSIQGSGHFQGFARFAGHPSNEKLIDLQSQGQGTGSGTQYWIDWIKRGNIPFQAARHLQNPYNENRKVQTSRDGQELEPTVGEALCRLWDKIPFMKQMMYPGDDLLDMGRMQPGSYPGGAAGMPGVPGAAGMHPGMRRPPGGPIGPLMGAGYRGGRGGGGSFGGAGSGAFSQRPNFR